MKAFFTGAYCMGMLMLSGLAIALDASITAALAALVAGLILGAAGERVKFWG